MIAGLYEGRGIFDLIAAAASAVAVWAHTMAAGDPVDDLMLRFRHPWQWALRHPLRALGLTRGLWTSGKGNHPIGLGMWCHALFYEEIEPELLDALEAQNIIPVERYMNGVKVSEMGMHR